jgi:hypothetical protein
MGWFVALAAVGVWFAMEMAAMAQTTGIGLTLQDTLNAVLTPMLTMAALWLVSKFAPKVPRWLYPLMAPALGALITFVTSAGTGENVNPIVGALLGSAAVGLHQVLSQWKQHQIGTTPTPPTP